MWSHGRRVEQLILVKFHEQLIVFIQFVFLILVKFKRVE